VHVGEQRISVPGATGRGPGERATGANGPAWQQYFPELASPDTALQRAMESARLLEVPHGSPVFHAGARCETYILVVQGQIRVQVIGEGGREVVLYRVQPGQSCVLTTCCLLSGETYPAEGHTEGAVRALVFDKTDFDRALDTAPAFRRLVFLNLGQRIAQVITRMEDVTFRPVAQRLARLLLAQARTGTTVNSTHQAIGVELGTAREVVSRHLKRLEAAGVVRLGRLVIEITDRARLEGVAAGRR